MRLLRLTLIILFTTFFSNELFATVIKDPATWTFEVKKKGNDKYELIFHLKLKEGWHIFSLKPGGDGTSLAPSFKFTKAEGFKANGVLKEKGTLIHEDLDGDGIQENFFEGQVDYTQEATIKGDMLVKGEHFYQVCDRSMCLPGKTKPFTFTIGTPKAAVTDSASVNDGTKVASTADSIAAIKATGIQDTSKKIIVAGAATPPPAENKGLLWLFFEALIGGILAVLTPCVYSMIPITVSFFTKRSKTRPEGLRNAFYYSLSIILIFTILGILISVLFGSNALNNLSTNWIANLFFFAVFVVFGISFLGAFEITLPASWTSKTDSKAGIGSFGGIFFMALTLVIVSFSCTGPIVGPLLVLAGRGGFVGPAIGMFGFSVGLAMPFALFAVFPGMLNKIASSGGWLNQVKVTLGFIELALALKFLSNADLARGWRLMDREVFIAIWVVLAILLGIYLLGRLKLSHDDAPPKNIYGQEYVSIFKLFLAIGCFSFAVYLVPGLWGAPLNAMSAFVPPMGTQDFVLSASNNTATISATDATNADVRPVKYVEEMKIYEPPVVKTSGLVTYFDYDEALAASKKLHKPVMLDFTGINCVNCRKMEAQVWSSPEVMKRLKNDFIIASLYCDYDKHKLPKEEQHFSQALQSDVITLGDKNEDLQASKFNANSQPFYFYVDEKGDTLISGGYSYDPDVNKFIAHLDKVKENYKKTHP